MSPFHHAKNLLVDLTALSKDALHIYVGLIIFLAACLVFGWKARQWKPWLVVLAAAVAGEVIDVFDSHFDNDPVRPYANVKDILNTMIAPTALMLVARWSGIFVPDVPSSNEAEVADPAPGAERDIGEAGD